MSMANSIQYPNQFTALQEERPFTSFVLVALQSLGFINYLQDIGSMIVCRAEHHKATSLSTPTRNSCCPKNLLVPSQFHFFIHRVDDWTLKMWLRSVNQTVAVRS